MLLRFSSLLLIFVLNALIGWYVLQKDPRRLSNRAFGFFAFTAAAWTVCVATAHNIPGHSTLFTRATFSMASLAIFALLVLLRAFPAETTLQWKGSLGLFFLTAVSMSALSFAPFIVSSALLESTGLTVHYGPWHPLYALYTYACFTASLFSLGRKYRTSSGLVRLQFNYFLLGLLLPGLGATITNLLVPLLIGNSRTGQYGPYFAVIFIGFTAHALIHYRFMDIRLVLRRSMTFVLAILGSVLALITCVIALWAIVPFDLPRSHLLLLLAASVVISTLLPLLRNALTTVFNRYVYRRDVDYAKALHDSSEALVTILDLSNLAAYATRTIQRALSSEAAALYLAHGTSFLLSSEQKHGPSGTTSFPVALSSTSPIAAFLSHSLDPLVAEEVLQRFSETSHQVLLRDLTALQWGLVLPIHSDNSLKGFLVLGPKLSGDPFFPHELDFLVTFINQVGIALRNAELYSQVALANEYITNILSTIESGVVAIDIEQNVTLCNKAAERMTGLRMRAFSKMSAEQLPPGIRTPLSATLIDGLPRTEAESLLLGDAGHVIPVVSSTSPLRDIAGTILGAVIVFSDLTKPKDLEREKRRNERLAAFGTLASGIAHEIKNPLVAIRTFAELLPERFTDTDFRDDFAKVVIREIARIDDLVGRLRGLAAPAPQQVGAVDIREPIADTLALLRAQLEQTRTTVHCDFQDPAPLVAVDAGQLKQLFLNVLLNSLEAMGAGGQLTIHLSRREIRASAWIVTEVSDTGPGISESVKANIFDPFFTTKPRGSGLGLAICRGITDAHRGSIRAENRTDHSGATIVIELPVSVATPLFAEERALHA